MLAQRGRVEDDLAPLGEAGYLFDLKIDGVRCLATVEDGQVTLVSRAGVTFTYQYPDVVAALRTLPPGRWVLDGEIAVSDERGLPSWPLTAKRNSQVRNTSGWAAKLPATYHVFDLLEHDGQDLRPWALGNRRHVLREALAEVDPGVRAVLSSYDGQAMWQVVVEHHLEGVVAKRPGSPYRNGRSSDWVKIKRTQTVTCLVGGYDPGEGHRADTFGALHLYLISHEGLLVQVGKVGSGFSNREVDQVMHALHHTPLVVEVEYLDVSPDGLLRQPVFQRIRSDVTVADCTLDQLKHA